MVVRRAFKASLFVFGIGLMLMAQFMLNGRLWLNWPTSYDPFKDFATLNCAIPVFCQMRFVPYFFVAFVMTLLGGILVISPIAHLPAAQVPHHLKLTYFSNAFDTPQPRWRWIAWLCLLVGLGLTGWLAWLVIFTPKATLTWIWLGAFTSLGLAFYATDRARGNTQFFIPLSHLGWSGVLFAYLLSLGFVYNVVAVPNGNLTLHWAIPVAISALLIIAWRVKLLPISPAIYGTIIVFAFAAMAQDLRSWRYAYIGDEYALYESAFLLVKTFWEIPSKLPSLLNIGVGSYGMIPIGANYLQAITVLLYGTDVYAWRIAEVVFHLFDTLPIFVIASTLAGRRAGWIAVACHSFSHLFFSLTKPGYAAGIDAWLYGAALLIFAVQRRNLLGIFLAGFMPAFGVYFSPLTIVLAPITGVLFLFYYLLVQDNRPVSGGFTAWLRCLWGNKLLVAAFALGILIASIPVAAQTTWIEQTIRPTVAQSEVKNVHPFWGQILPNWIYTLSGFLGFAKNSHYITGALVDPLSSIFMALGILLCLRQALRFNMATWLGLAYLMNCFLIGGIVSYSFPSLTRSVNLVPMFAILTALGIESVLRVLDHFVRAKWISALAFATILASIFALNLYNFHVLLGRTELVDNAVRPTPVSFIVREFERNPNLGAVYVAHNNVGDPQAKLVVRAYGYTSGKVTATQELQAEQAIAKLKPDLSQSFVVLYQIAIPQEATWKTIGSQHFGGKPISASVVKHNGLAYMGRIFVGEGDVGP
ncbi:MAG: glycosyltransferase family 39 protein [Anaerolineae bacterium]|nr:glycosyltransferase family 39 protein [Anaerolineae bacterium]